MSLLDDEEILVNNDFPIIEEYTKNIAKELSIRFFQKFVDNHYILNNDIENLYVSYDNSKSNKGYPVGQIIGEYLISKRLNATLINCKGCSILAILHILPKLPEPSVIILSEASKMLDNNFQQVIKILKGWSDSGYLSFRELYNKGVYTINTPTILDKRLLRKNFKFIFLDTETLPKREYLQLPLYPYGNFIINNNNYEFIKGLGEHYQIIKK